MSIGALAVLVGIAILALLLIVDYAKRGGESLGRVAVAKKTLLAGIVAFILYWILKIKRTNKR